MGVPAGLEKAALPPAVRVNVVDRESRESLDDIATVTFTPHDDRAPVRIPLRGAGRDGKLAALQTLPARRFDVRCSAPGYSQARSGVLGFRGGRRGAAVPT